MRLLLYSQDGMGLGHLRRASNIACELLRRDAATDVVIVGDSPAATVMQPRRGLDFVKLPTVVKTGASEWESGSLSLEPTETVELRSRLIVDTFEAFAPDVVLVDHMPVGALGELKPLLARARAARRAPRLFLGLRDVLDEPHVVRRVWRDVGAYEHLGAYDAVLVYGTRDILDADAAYGLRPHARRIEYCGSLVRAGEPADGRGDGEPPFVLAMGGGGADAYPLARAFLEALPAVLRSVDVHACVVAGPNMPPGDRRRLEASAAGLPVEVVESGDTASLLARASAVVTMAGYNSSCEVLKWRRPAILVPRRGPSAEQRIRSRLFAERGLVLTLEPEHLTPARLADEVLQLLQRGNVPRAAAIPALDGAQRAAEIIGSPRALEARAA